jgi:hypothetical protein
MIASSAIGNPAVVASSISWSAREIARHSTIAGIVFAGIQLLIAIGIAWRPTVKPALALSVVWSLGVWWIGEGFGGLLEGRASPLTGAPGAVVLYALLAVLLWPADAGSGHVREDFVAARPIGALPARLVWLGLWSGLGWLSLSSGRRALPGVRSMIRSMAFGEPRWLTSLDDAVARDLAGHGSVVAIIMAAVFGVIALGVFAPRSVRRAILLLAVVAALVIWVVGEGFGGLFSGPSTDPNSGPLLIVLAAAFWPLRASRVTAERPATSGAAAIAAAIVAAAAADGRG